MEMIPEVVRKFIAKHIQSVDILEILLVLQKEPWKEWAPVAVSNALRLDETSVHSRLQRLVVAQVISSRYVGREQVFHYDPATPDLAHAVRELAKWYSSHPVALISLIYSNPADEFL